jgi:AcrR family transcriptional regulator
MTAFWQFGRHYVAVKSECPESVVTYCGLVPKLWNETIDAHRQAVRDAILDTTASLVADHGLASVTMSQIAEGTGIGRATLYNYFADVELILFAWHERQIAAHLQQLTEIRDRAGNARQRLEAVLEAYAFIAHESSRHRDTEIASLLHRDEQVARAQQQLSRFIGDLVTEAAKTGGVRADVAPGELATYCLHALTAGSSLRSKIAVRRLVALTLDALRPPH